MAYKPPAVPLNPKDLPRFLQTEFERIAQDLADNASRVFYRTNPASSGSLSVSNGSSANWRVHGNVLLVSTSQTQTFTGLQRRTPNLENNREVVFMNIGSGVAVLKNQASESSASNRFALVQDYNLSQNACVTLWRDPFASRWRGMSIHGVQNAGASGGSSTAVPGTIKDLVFWWESDDILGTNGQPVQSFGNRTPWARGVFGFQPGSSTGAGSLPTVGSSTQNGLPVITWGGSQFNTAGTIGFFLNTDATFFVVCQPNATVGAQAILGGQTNSLALYLCSSSKAICLVKTGASVIGTSSTAWTSNTWFQANATYKASTGAYAFRQGQASAGSGTGATVAGTGLTVQLGSDANTNALVSGVNIAALIVFARQLTNAEILSVESYLNSKWNV